MAAEAASAAAGPRYAPDDPTLPKPWKGLIDGSTGITYYWNPETNITQYEKPGSAAPPVPSGVPHVDTASQSTMQQVPQHGQSADVSQYPQQYMNQLTQQQGHFQGPLHGQMSQQHGQFQGPAGQIAQQQPAQIPPTGQQQYAQFGQGMPQRGSQVGQAPVQQGQTMQQPQQQQHQHYGPQMNQQSGQQLLPQQGSQTAQHPIQHNSQQPGQQAPLHQGPAMGQSPGHHYMPQQMHYAAYQQPSMVPPGQQNAQPHPPHMPQGPQFSYQQDNRNMLSQQQDDSEFPMVKQTGVSMSQEPSGRPTVHGPPSMNASSHGLQASPRPGQAQPFASSMHMHQPPLNVKLQENRNDVVNPQHPSTYQNHMGQPMMSSQQHGMSPVGRNMGYDDNKQLRSGQGYNLNANKEAPMVAPHHTNLAALPMARNQQDLRMGAFPHQNMPPAHDGGLNPAAAHGMHVMHNHANSDLPISNQPFMRPPPIMPGSSDVMNISSAEAYRQQHEVTATGENVPAPFMTFEATGFPPEILREVRYLLRWGAYVVRCTAMRTLYMQQILL